MRPATWRASTSTGTTRWPAPVPAGAFTVNGLVELLPFNRRFGLAMERSFSVGAGNTIKLYRYALAGADDVSRVADLDDAAPVREAGKALVLDLDTSTTWVSPWTTSRA